MGKVIQGLIFLALIAGVVIGAKMFVLDPMEKDKKLQTDKKKITKYVSAGDYQKAIDECDALADKYPKQKAYAKERKFNICLSWAEKEHDAGMEFSNKAAKAKREKNRSDYDAYLKQMKDSASVVVKAVTIADQCGQIKKVHQQWKSIAYGNLGQKEKAVEAMKRQAELSD